ncbi:30S ribosomal protein S6e [Candidatus Woesearchaeota archaeon]|nr:30S ribosomal protein S6e [Candidatus Woesearchaeota archaeon]
MVELKVVLNDMKTGKSYQKIVKEEDAKQLMNLRIGDKVKGETISLAGYELEIRGGSNTAGFPMRKDARGIGMRKILAVGGTGIKTKDKGIRQRRTVVGTKIDSDIAQLNMVILKHGAAPLEEKKESPKQDEKKETKEAEKKEESPKEAPAEKTEEKQSAEKK